MLFSGIPSRNPEALLICSREAAPRTMASMLQTLFLMVGYPGAGKTTAARLIHEQTGAVHVWADHERKLRFAHPDYSHPETIQLYKQLNRVVDELLAQGKSVIFDTNFNFFKDRQKLRRMAAKHGAQAIIVWVIAPKELARARAVHEDHAQDTRVFGNMPLDHFKRIVRHLQPPHEDEHAIKLDGRGITPNAISAALRELP
jgi:predicted kinase